MDSEKGGQRPIQDGQFVTAPSEMGVNRRPHVVWTSQVDHGQRGQERQHSDRAGVETEATEDPTEVQPVPGQDGTGVRH